MKMLLGVLLATVAGSAAAGDLSEPRYYESNDYSAQVYYRLDFGGPSRHAQSVGLRFDSVRAEAAGAPSILQVRFGEQGLDRLALNGLDLRAAMLASGQTEGGMAGWFSGLSTVELVGLAVVGVGFIAVGADVADEEDDSLPGTGGS